MVFSNQAQLMEPLSEVRELCESFRGSNEALNEHILVKITVFCIHGDSWWIILKYSFFNWICSLNSIADVSIHRNTIISRLWGLIWAPEQAYLYKNHWFFSYFHLFYAAILLWCLLMSWHHWSGLQVFQDYQYYVRMFTFGWTGSSFKSADLISL